MTKKQMQEFKDKIVSGKETEAKIQRHNGQGKRNKYKDSMIQLLMTK